jgi:membrane protease YdiL (CAAX protease family)
MESSNGVNGRSPVKYFVLVFILSIPFWVIAQVHPIFLLPGLPISSLMIVTPVIAALILLFITEGAGGAIELLKRSFDLGRNKKKIWYLPAILVMPAVAIASYGIMRLLGRELPAPDIQWMSVPGLFLMFFVAGLLEELGWSGYVLDPMQDRMGAFSAGIVLGIIWFAWHVIPFFQADRAFGWIAGQGLVMVASRILIVWLYNNTGKSVFIAALCHTMINVSWQLFPVDGSHYNPWIVGLITVPVVMIVVIVWGPKTLVGRKPDEGIS